MNVLLFLKLWLRPGKAFGNPKSSMHLFKDKNKYALTNKFSREIIKGVNFQWNFSLYLILLGSKNKRISIDTKNYSSQNKKSMSPYQETSKEYTRITDQRCDQKIIVMIVACH